jgi:hypothetical protein
MSRLLVLVRPSWPPYERSFKGAAFCLCVYQSQPVYVNEKDFALL